ncbi:hypothetical protein QBC37DRAFT_425874 [Rhypophila decipiens]|uniref:Uncharacterized protein n=1 Tax=Rhypophila decipiens TaxID=261697 RepID=A0AAN6Y4Z6_9PEZI|nr:hypothetical protein QBC37DRAFT_425874 [Rhypophila decipiens]
MGSRNMLLGSSRTTFDAISRPTGLQFSRCFSWTASRDAKHRPIKFHYTNPELHEILKTIREKIIIPSYLSEDQKKKVYDYRCQKELEIDPIVVDVDGEEFKFGYINPRQDVPNTKKLVQQAVDHMKTKSDISNVAPLLEGLKQAKRSVDSTILPKIVRRAGLADATSKIVDAAGWVERTNFRLIHSETVNMLLCFIQEKALDSEWDKEETLKALKQANKVIEVMEERKENHPDGMSWNEGMTLRKKPLYRDPQVLAARLHLAAVLAVKHYDGKDVDGLVTKYAQEVVALWPKDVGLLGLHPERAYQTKQDMAYLVRKEGLKFAWYAAPILHGFKLAALVVEPELKQALLTRAEKLEAEIKQTKPRFESVEVYRKLFDANIGPTEEAEPVKEEEDSN